MRSALSVLNPKLINPIRLLSRAILITHLGFFIIRGRSSRRRCILGYFNYILRRTLSIMYGPVFCLGHDLHKLSGAKPNLFDGMYRIPLQALRTQLPLLSTLLLRIR